MHTGESLQSDLAAMGLNPTGTVLMHSSMKAIGAVDGGADAVLDALCAYFAAGLLALPTHTWATNNADNLIFDVLTSRCCVGILPELFRKRPGVLRSWHPTHSIAAIGARAAQFTAGDEGCDSPCARTSAWGRLYDWDATVLLVGCGLTKLTYLHGVEEWADVPNRLGDRIPFVVRTPDGRRIDAPSRPHRGMPSEQFGLAQDALEAVGALRRGRLGDAEVILIDARKTADAMIPILQKNPSLFDDPV